MAAERIDQAGADGAQDDFPAFAAMVGRPVTAFQAEAMELRTRHTALLAPRQTGKSRTLATRVAHWAFTKPGQEVLVISAREDTAKNLLREVRRIAALPMLRTSVVDDLKTRLELSNGSAVEAVPSSEAAIRGRSVDLLCCDESAFIPAELIESAALPTTMARPDARIILASTPWGTDGTFFDWYEAGEAGDDPDTRSFRWRLADCDWIVPSVVESLRRRLAPIRFRAEVMGEWVGSGDSFFSLEDIDAAIAAFPMAAGGNNCPATLGADWGGGDAGRDLQAVAIAGVLDDGGINRQPIVVVPYCETSRRGFPEQEDHIADLAARWNLTIFSEDKGVGIPSTRALTRKLIHTRVVPVKTSERIKEEAYTRLLHLMAGRQIVLPDHAELRKQLAGIVAKPLPLGGLKIGARTERIHDDLPDALAFAVWGLPGDLAEPPEHDWPENTQWAQTTGGVRIPLPVSTVRADVSYDGAYGGLWRCGICGLGVSVSRETCRTQGCAGRNPDYRPPPLASPQAQPATPAPPSGTDDGDPESVPVPNYADPDLRECLRCGHKFSGRYLAKCPRCYPGHGGMGGRPGPFPGGGTPDKFRQALGLGGFRRP